MSNPSCRGIKELLGVYVVGAIEPAERALVDDHLADCAGCRKELAGLAGLPALLRRVPLADAERLAAPDAPPRDLGDAQPELLTRLLGLVAARRRTNRLRSVFAIAAALLIAAGGTGAVVHALSPPASGQPSASDVARKSTGALSAVVKYGPSSWGTQMWVLTKGIRQGITCKFWVLTRSRGPELVSGWTVGPDASRIWYPAGSPVPADQITGFLITSAGKVLLDIPAES
jgi:Putative zinc-finger